MKMTSSIGSSSVDGMEKLPKYLIVNEQFILIQCFYLSFQALLPLAFGPFLPAPVPVESVAVHVPPRME
jgi:hypothetical protein